MSQMSLINLIELGVGGGGDFYTALPRVYVTLTLICFGQTLNNSSNHLHELVDN